MGNEHSKRLITACEEGNLENVKMELEKGADPNYQDILGQTPLIIAIYSSNKTNVIEIIQQLIDKGANVNHIKESTGIPALFEAVRIDEPSIVETLLKFGADPNIITESGNSPMSLSIYKSLETFTLLLSYDGDPNTVNTDGNPLLHIAIQKGVKGTRFVEKLIKAGANVNINDKNGNTPLQLASKQGNTFVVKKLIEAGATVNISDKNGNTPLMLASQTGRLNTVKWLLANEADKNYINNAGQTALQLALANNNEEIADLLRNWNRTMAIAVLKELNVLSGINPDTIKTDLQEYIGEGGKKRNQKSKKNKKRSIKRRK